MSAEEPPKKAPKSQIARNVAATNFSYTSEPMFLSATGINQGEIFFSGMGEDTDGGELSATVFIDRKNKQITYAIAGTRIDQGLGKAVADLKDDFKLLIGSDPEKLAPLKSLNIKILEHMGHENLVGYELNFTGHSLGAVLADCAAADMVGQMKNFGLDIPQGITISSVTFDNPGAITQVKKICDQYVMTLEDLKRDVGYKVFNNRDNVINTMDNQVGEKYTIVPTDQKPLHPFYGMCANIARKCKSIPVVRSIFSHLSRGKLTQQIADHSLDNFDAVLAKGAGYVRSPDRKRLMTIEEVSTGKEPLKYDQELFDKLKVTPAELTQQEKQQQSFSMRHPDGSIIEFSHKQLSDVLEEKKASLPAASKAPIPPKGKWQSIVAQISKKKSVTQAISDAKEAKKLGNVWKMLKKPNPSKIYMQRSAEEVMNEVVAKKSADRSV